MKGYKAGSPRQSPQHVPSCFPRCTVFYFTSYRTSSGHSVGLYYVRFLQSVWLHKQYKTSWPSPRKNHRRDVRKSSSRRACHRCDQPKIHSLMAFSFATALKVNILSTYFLVIYASCYFILGFLGSTHTIVVSYYFCTK
jgi:hypothetical protein